MAPPVDHLAQENLCRQAVSTLVHRPLGGLIFMLAGTIAIWAAFDAQTVANCVAFGDMIALKLLQIELIWSANSLVQEIDRIVFDDIEYLRIMVLSMFKNRCLTFI
jgi:hypothetical protein